MAGSKAWSLRLFAARLRLGLEEVAAQLSTAQLTLPQALEKGIEAYRQQLTTVHLCGLWLSVVVVPLTDGTPKVYVSRCRNFQLSCPSLVCDVQAGSVFCWNEYAADTQFQGFYI
jgi:hypothetical protein